MTEVISPDNKELLTYVLGDIHNKLYIDVVRDLKQQTEQKLESGELEPADFLLHIILHQVFIHVRWMQKQALSVLAKCIVQNT